MIRAALLAVALLVAGNAGARDLLPTSIAADAPGLSQRGSGTYRWLGFEIYTATLWTAGVAPDFGRPFALALRYARTLNGRAIADRSADEIEKLALATPEQLAAWRTAMAGVFPDVARGTTLTGLHLPGRGARFFRDGQPIGDIADAAFARAFFSIWLHPQTSAPDLRTALLGER